MEIKEFGRLYKRLSDAFDKEVKPGQVQVYFDFLGKFPVNGLAFAVDKAILYNQFFPRISELVDLIKEYKEMVPVERQLSENPEKPCPPTKEFMEAKEKFIKKTGIVPGVVTTNGPLSEEKEAEVGAAFLAEIEKSKGDLN